MDDGQRISRLQSAATGANAGACACHRSRHNQFRCLRADDDPPDENISSERQVLCGKMPFVDVTGQNAQTGWRPWEGQSGQLMPPARVVKSRCETPASPAAAPRCAR